MIRWILLAALVAIVWRAARSLLPVPRTADGPGVEPRAGDRVDPWTVLGVARGASREEIVSAYRDQMKRYHPDRVADLGPELRRLAHEKTVEIQRAYDALIR